MFRSLILGICIAFLCLVHPAIATDHGRDADPDFVGWWKLDETSGTVASDSSGRNFRGVLRNGPTWIEGIDGGALEFDGRNDYVAIANVYYGRIANPQVTVALWVRTESEDDQILLSFDRSEYWRLEINGAVAEPGRIGWSLMTDAGQADLAGQTRIDDGQWHHVASVFDRGAVSIYIDGKLDASKRHGTTFGTGNPRFGFFGVGSEATNFDGDKGPENYLKGALDDVRLYTRALSAAEIGQLAAPAGQDNDDCRNAQPVGDVLDLPFDTTQATHDGQGIVMRSPNLWYRYSPACTGIATVSLCGSQFDTMVAVYRGTECFPGPDRLIAANDDACGLQSEVTFDAAAGQEYLIEVGGYGQAVGQGVLTLACEAVANAEFDLGDAPDSSGSGARMTAYVSASQGTVDAHFPTVARDASGRPSGPLHIDPLGVAHLGEAVTLENEADRGTDEDQINNIDPARDKADQDGADDGVILPIVMPQAGWASFDYLVNVVTPGTDLWVNVWCDFNRDGDWDDDSTTNPEMDAGSKPISEWAVRNQYLFDLPAGLHQISTPAFRSWHPVKGPEEIWMRITLSEQPWKGGENPSVMGNGGSGPAEGYAIGETEDYRFVPELDCVLCQDLNEDGKIDFDDLIELMYDWIDNCME
jgi:hypothetical protein